MAVFSKQSLITELLDRTELIKASTQPFFRFSNEQLLQPPGPGRWSVAQVFEHLNISHDIYIRSILTRISLAPDVSSDTFRSGWLGEWIYEKLMPRADGTVFKLKALKSHQSGERLEDGREILERFLRKCDAIDDILRHVYHKDLQRIRIPTAVSRLISLRLGDTLRVMVAHGERHLLQAQQATESII